MKQHQDSTDIEDREHTLQHHRTRPWKLQSRIAYQPNLDQSESPERSSTEEQGGIDSQ